MKKAANRFLLVIAIACLASGSTPSAEPEKRFEGPYRITSSAPKKIRATVKSAYRYPNLAAQEWMVAYPVPPEFDGQPIARARFQILEAPLAEAGRMNDESGLRQPLATLHWMPESNEGAHGFTVEATYDLTITRRKLEPGEPARPVTPLSPGASGRHFWRPPIISTSRVPGFRPGSRRKI